MKHILYMKGNKIIHTQKSPNWNQAFWLLFIGFLVINIFIFQIFSSANYLELSCSDFKNKASQGKISQITIKGDKLTGSFKKPVKKVNGSGSPDKDVVRYEYFETVLPPFQDPELIELLEDQEVIIKAESEERSWAWTLAVSFLPWLLIIGFFIYTGKKIQERAGGGALFGFRKSKAKLFTKSAINITYDDVAGLLNTKKELQEIVDFLKAPSKYTALGGQLPRGILLVGPPGTGKTLMARATAGEANVPFFSISGSEFIEMFVGVGASRVRDMFKQAKKEAPSIIFIDELDSIGRTRGAGLGGSHDERE